VDAGNFSSHSASNNDVSVQTASVHLQHLPDGLLAAKWNCQTGVSIFFDFFTPLLLKRTLPNFEYTRNAVAAIICRACLGVQTAFENKKDTTYF